METVEIVNHDALKMYTGRIENLHKDRDTINEDIRAVYREAKDAGFDTTTLREIVREQRMEAPARESRYALLDSYRRALGLLADTPLGAAAMSSAEREPAPKPRPFADQPLHRGRGRPRKNGAQRMTVDDAIAAAREPVGTA